MVVNIPAELQKASGIYEIRNLTNDRVYVGSTNGFGQRQRCHKSTMIRHKKVNGRLFNAYLKYGIDAFSFSVIEVVERQPGETRERFYARLLLRELHHIERLGANNRETGYNIRIDPISNFGATLPRRPVATAPPKPNQAKGENNHRAVLSESIVLEIKLLSTIGIPVSCIATTLNQTPHRVHDVILGKVWRDVTFTEQQLAEYIPPPIVLSKSYKGTLREIKLCRYLSSLGYGRRSIARFMGVDEQLPRGSIKDKYSWLEPTEAEKVEFEKCELVSYLKQVETEGELYSAKLSANRRGRSRLLTPEQVLTIKKDLQNGVPIYDIASKFTVGHHTVRKIAEGKNWSHLTEIQKGDIRIQKGKFNDDEKALIERLLIQGEMATRIAERYKVSVQCICYIRDKMLVRQKATTDKEGHCP